MREITVYDRLTRSAQRWPDRPFFRVLAETAIAYRIQPRTWSFAEAVAEITPLAHAYRSAGYGPGHRVGLLLENRPDFLWHWLALNAVGASIVPINRDLRRAELTYLIEHSDMAMAVAVPERHHSLAEAAPELTLVTPADAPGPIRASTMQPSQTTECALLYTSGTTGRPKGCMLSNFYFLNAGDWYAGVGGLITLSEDPAERILTPLPLFHVNALAFSVMAMMTVGGCLSILDRFHPRTWWDSVRETDATIIHYLGIMPPVLMAQPEGPGDRDHRVRAGFGAGVDPALHRPAEERFGFPFVEGWAMTETGAGGVIMASKEPRHIGTACFGRPRNGVEARIIDDQNCDVPQGDPGELLIRQSGPNPQAGFFLGYLKDQTATDKAWAGGWLHTGDVVREGDDGSLHFVDRTKNIIRRSGENISAAEVESVLGQHPEIARVAVAPTSDPVRGEEVIALIIPTGSAGPEIANEITRWCVEQMAYYKAPGWVVFVDDLPVTATEKIQRGEIRNRVAAVIEEGAAFDTRSLKVRG